MATALSTNQAAALYNAVLLRNGSASEQSYWATQIDAGVTLGQVTTSFVNSAEALNVVDPIIRIYQGGFGRAPDAAGLRYFVGLADSGVSANSIAQSFVLSAEFATQYGANIIAPTTAAETAFVNALYTHYLGRTADSAGLAYWLTVLGTPTASSEANLVLSFGNSAENVSATQAGANAYLTAGANTALAATTATTVGGATYPATLQSPSDTVALTAGLDNLSGFRNTSFTATYSDAGVGAGNTLQLGDTITGPGGTNANSLTITPNAAIAGGAGATTLQDAIWANVTNMSALSVTTTAGAISVGTGAAFNAAFASSAKLTAASTDGPITLNLSGSTFQGVASSVAYAGPETISVTTNGVGAQGISTGTGLSTVSAVAAGGAQTVLGSNLTSISLTNSGAGAQTVTSTGSAAVTVQASANGGLQTITTGSGNDIITIGPAASVGTSASLATINAGLGTDTITLSTSHTGVNTIQFGPAARETTPTPYTGANANSPTGIDTIINFIGGKDVLAFSTATFGNGNAIGVAATNIGVYASTAVTLGAANADIAGNANLAALAGHQSILIVGSNTVGGSVDVYIENAGGNLANTVAQEVAANQAVLVAHVSLVGGALTVADFAGIA